MSSFAITNYYKFENYKEQVIELLLKVCTVSVETMKIVGEMEKGGNHE
jgi:predicted helicase